MTDPNAIAVAITNLERELRDLGWRPVTMLEPNTGQPFTRWFPPQIPNHAEDESDNAAGDRT